MSFPSARHLHFIGLSIADNWLAAHHVSLVANLDYISWTSQTTSQLVSKTSKHGVSGRLG